MKKRIFSLMLALMLCLSLLPMAALAEEGAVAEIAPESTVEPAAVPTAEPLAEPTASPVTEPESDSVVEPTASPVATPVEEPAVEPSADTETEPTDAPESTPEADSETQPTPEPTAAPSEQTMPIALDSAGETPPANAVAEVTNNGQTDYPTNAGGLISLLQSSGTTYVKLLKNVTLSVDIELVSPNLTLDLNGYTLSTSKNITIGTVSSSSNAALTITDSGAAKTGKLELTKYSQLKVYNNDKLTVQSGTVEAKDTKYIYFSVYGTMTVSGGTVSTNNIYVDGTMTVSGGTVQGSVSCEADSDDLGMVAISGGELQGSVSCGGGMVTVSGGTVDSVNGKSGYLNLSGGTFGSVSCSGGSVSDLVGFLAAGYAYFAKDASGAYSDVTAPTTNAISDVQVKAHECEFDDSHQCTKGCGRSYAREPVRYLDEYGVEQFCGTYTPVTATLTDWSSGWYVVNNSVELESIKLSGDVHLILCDGKTLTVTKGILGSGADSLTVYAQSTGSQIGKLAVTGGAKDTSGYTKGIDIGGTFTVNGGDITVNILPLDTKEIYGVYIKDEMTVNGGCISVTTGDVNGGEKNAYNYGIYAYDDLTVNAGGTVTAKAGNAESKDGCAYSYGIRAYDDLTVNGGSTVTATAGNAESEDRYAESYGIWAYDDLTVDGGTVTATGGNAESEDSYAYSYGIYAYDDLTADGGTVTATAGNATAGNGYAKSYGIWAYYDFKVNGGTVTATGGNAESEDSYAESYGIYAREDLEVNGATVKATAGKAESEDGSGESYGIHAKDDFKATGATVMATASDAKTYSNGICVYDMTVEGSSTVTATAGTAAVDEYDIYVYDDFKLYSGAVQRGSNGGAASVYAGSLAVTGGTIKLRDSYLGEVSVSEGVKLADLPAVGYAYWGKEAEKFFSPTDLEPHAELVAVYVKPCTMHSTSDKEVCAYCGWEPSPETPTPAPTAKPAHSPQTGDEANVMLWLGLMTASVIGVAVIARKKKAK